MSENEIGTGLLGAAIEVHRKLGSGLLESVYEVVLARELELAGLKVARQVPIPIKYKGLEFTEGFRADLIVAHKVLVELKSVEAITAAHKKQVQIYLALTGLKLVPYRLNSAQFAQDIFVMACNCLEFSILLHKNKNFTPERFLAPAPLA
jgi:GxxExxY protein